MSFRSLWRPLLLIASLLLAACGGVQGGRDLDLAPPSALSDEIRRLPPEVRDAYRFSVANHELLQSIPCYCGCGAPPHGHMNNADCYVDQIRSDGTVIYDNHAYT